MKKLLAKISFYWMIASFVGGFVISCFLEGFKIKIQDFKGKVLLLRAIKDSLNDRSNIKSSGSGISSLGKKGREQTTGSDVGSRTEKDQTQKGIL